MKKTNIKKELKKYYKNEAELLRLPPESEIRALSNVRSEDHPSLRRQHGKKLATVCACCLLLVLTVAMFPIMNHIKSPVLPIDNNTSLLNGSVNNPTIPSLTDPGTTSAPGGNSQDDVPPVVPQYSDLSMLSLSVWLSEPNVIWSSSDGTKSNTVTGIQIPQGTSLITDELRAQISDHDSESVYAVMVDFSSGVTEAELLAFEYEGKTIASLENELMNLRLSGKVIDTRIITYYDGATGKEVTDEIKIYDNADEIRVVSAKISEAKRNFYFACLENYKESFKAMGLGIYNESEGCTIENMIFYTFATKAQLENFVCKSTEAFVFDSAIRFK